MSSETTKNRLPPPEILHFVQNDSLDYRTDKSTVTIDMGKRLLILDIAIVGYVRYGF